MVDFLLVSACLGLLSENVGIEMLVDGCVAVARGMHVREGLLKHFLLSVNDPSLGTAAEETNAV